jgi:adenylate cyclase class IV
MSALGEDYVTEFGEFLEFETTAKDDREYHEDFVEWIPLADIEPTSSPTFARIRESIVRVKQEAGKR